MRLVMVALTVLFTYSLLAETSHDLPSRDPNLRFASRVKAKELTAEQAKFAKDLAQLFASCPKSVEIIDQLIQAPGKHDALIGIPKDAISKHKTATKPVTKE